MIKSWIMTVVKEWGGGNGFEGNLEAQQIVWSDWIWDKKEREMENDYGI